MRGNKKELMQYRLDMAKDRLQSAKLLLDNGSYKDSIGRSYYAIFTAVRALLAVDGVDFYIVSRNDAAEQYERALEFYTLIKDYLHEI